MLSAKGGAPNIDEATFEFVARGRVPHLMVQLSFLSMTAAAKRVAAMLGEKGQGGVRTGQRLDARRGRPSMRPAFREHFGAVDSISSISGG